MNMADYEKAALLISRNPQIYIAGPRPAVLVSDMEAVLTMRLPATYRRFLLEFGACELSPVQLYGIPGADLVNRPLPAGIVQTISLREKCKFPLDLLVLGDVGDGSLYCIEARPDGSEGRVVVVEPGQEPLLRDTVATDFGEFFLAQIKQALVIRAMSPAERQQAMQVKPRGSLPG